MLKIVCISDTHKTGYRCFLPKGDILIHSGDLGIRDEFDLNYELNYFSDLGFKHVIFIGGNHDLYLEQLYKAKIDVQTPINVHYLMNNSITVNGIKFWGSPYSPVYNKWVFMGFLPELKKIWDTIPLDTDIIITHCPPFGINDQVKGISMGCPGLRDKIKEIKPKFHIHGHIHEGHGIYCDENTTYVNASLMDGFYSLCNKPLEIDYENDLS